MYPHSQVWRPVAAFGALVAATLFATSTITVAAGDTLSEIAERHDVTVTELIAWNDIDDPDRIFAGTTLIVTAPQSAQVPGSATPGVGAATHLVTAGETLSAIAARFGTTIARLVSANDLADPDQIFIGQRLDLTGSAPVRAEPAAAPSRTHTVAPGDTLTAIAARYGVKTGVLASDNGITDADHIVIGRVLSIGRPSTVAAPPPTTTTPTPTTTTPTPTTTAAPVTTPSPPPPTTTTPTTTTPQPRRGGEVLLVPLFARWSSTYNVPQDLIEAIAWFESDWQVDAVGPGGHLGITQLSPATVALIEGGLIGRDLDPLDAEDGIQLATRFLRYLLDRTDNEREAIAAWKQGLSSVQRDGVTTVGAAYVDAVEEIRRLRR